MIPQPVSYCVQRKGSTYRKRIDEGLLHVVAELVADHAPEHAHVFEGQVVDVQVAGRQNLKRQSHHPFKQLK